MIFENLKLNDEESLKFKPRMTQKEAAEFLGISSSKLNRLRESGKIKFYAVGFRILYDKEKHLIPFLEESERNNN